MTVAKPKLLEARRLLLRHLDIHPGRDVGTDLDPAEVGVNGGPSHVAEGTSYHLGKDQLKIGKDPYSVVESPRDRRGLDNHSSAMDIGEFRITVNGKSYDLRHFSAWLVNLCRQDDPDTADIREVIYSLDGKTVRRLDDLGKRSSGDGSHRWHTHVSIYRDADGSCMVRLVTRYLKHIGLLAGEDDDMAVGEDIYRLLHDGKRGEGRSETSGGGVPIAWIVREIGEIKSGQAKAQLRDEAILAAVRDDADRDAILARIEQKATELKAEVNQVPAETVEALGAVDSPQEIADRLRAGLGDKAAAVGEILAAG